MKIQISEVSGGKDVTNFNCAYVREFLTIEAAKKFAERNRRFNGSVLRIHNHSTGALIAEKADGGSWVQA